MQTKRYKVVLELELDPSRSRAPYNWDWVTLIDISPDEQVTVTECHEVPKEEKV